MSYEPTNWKKGDKVTSTRLNKIEQGIQGNDTELTSVKENLSASQGLLIGEGEAYVSIWEEGSISGTGGNTTSSTRIRTKADHLLGFANGQLYVTCGADYEMFFAAYNQNGTYVGRLQEDGKIGNATGAWVQSLNLIDYSEYLFRAVLRNKNDATATITVSESSNVFFGGEKYASKTVKEDVAAINSAIRPTINTGNLELGSFNSNGSNIESTTRRRTNWIAVQQNGKYYVSLPENWYFVASDLTDLVVGSWTNSSEFTVRTTYLRIAVKYNTVDPTATSSDTDLTNISAGNVITLKDMNSFNVIADKGFSEVGSNSSYPYTNVQSALSTNPNIPVFVNFGSYDTEVSGLGTDKNLIGVDRDLCVLYGTGRNYDSPIIEISGGVVKNFTINIENDPDAQQFGYCLHSDDSSTANKALIVSNCKFENDLYRVIGMGVRGGETVIFENCEFIGHASATGQAIYIHNSTGTKATVKFRNCIFKAVNECLLLQGWGSDCVIDWEFIGCTCISETYGTGIETVWTDYVSGSAHDQNRLHEFSGKFSLLATSHGNNVSVLNA